MEVEMASRKDPRKWSSRVTCHENMKTVMYARKGIACKQALYLSRYY